jgi:hypothetical protein
MATSEEMVTLTDAKEQVRKVCVRLGLLHLSFARTLVDEFGEQKGKELVLKAIKDYGVRIGERAKQEAAEAGLDNSPPNFKSDLPAYGMIERKGEALPVQAKTETRRNLGHGCVMCQVWREYGESELGRLYCYVDPVKSMAFNPNSVTLHARLGEQPDGEWVCEFVTRATTEQERRDFADRDKTWAWADIEPWAGKAGVTEVEPW